MCITEYNEQETQQAFYNEGCEEGRERTLISLVKKNIISVKQAANELGETEEAFAQRMQEPATV